MAFSYYIYYRAEPAQAPLCEQAAHRMLAAISAQTGIAGRLLKKRNEPNLWMEVYEGVSDDAAFEWELAEAASRLRMRDFLLPGTDRHIECFEDRSWPCA